MLNLKVVAVALLPLVVPIQAITASNGFLPSSSSLTSSSSPLSSVPSSIAIPKATRLSNLFRTVHRLIAAIEEAEERLEEENDDGVLQVQTEQESASLSSSSSSDSSPSIDGVPSSGSLCTYSDGTTELISSSTLSSGISTAYSSDPTPDPAATSTYPHVYHDYEGFTLSCSSEGQNVYEYPVRSVRDSPNYKGAGALRVLYSDVNGELLYCGALVHHATDNGFYQCQDQTSGSSSSSSGATTIATPTPTPAPTPTPTTNPRSSDNSWGSGWW